MRQRASTRCGRGFKVAFVFALGFQALLAPMSAIAQGQPHDERAVKAAFVFNLTKYVEWPQKTDEIVIGFRGQDQTGEIFKKMLDGRTSDSKVIRVLLSPSEQDLARCNILYIVDPSPKNVRAALDPSNFGALNCVEDITGLARGLAKLLKPGASAVLSWMGPACVWEMVWYLAHGNRNKAFRRWNSQGVVARIANGVSLLVHYPSVKLLASTFAPDFRLNSIKGIGVAVPPSYLEPWGQRHPRLLKMCKHLDSWAARSPGIRLLGDHILVRLERES